MPEYLLTDKSIKPKDMMVGDLISGYHEDNPQISPYQMRRDGMNIASPVGPYEVTMILSTETKEHYAGVYHQTRSGPQRYSDYDIPNRRWIVIRDRPGIPKFIPDYPGSCPVCRGKIYVGLNQVIHERGGGDRCPRL